MKWFTSELGRRPETVKNPPYQPVMGRQRETWLNLKQFNFKLLPAFPEQMEELESGMKLAVAVSKWGLPA